jgi:hypothetical protein
VEAHHPLATVFKEEKQQKVVAQLAGEQEFVHS